MYGFSKKVKQKKNQTWVSKSQEKKVQWTNVSWRAKRNAARITMVLDSTNQKNYETIDFQGAANLWKKQATGAEMVS